MFDHILKELNDFQYHKLIMFDLEQIITSNKIQIHDFFGRSEDERKDKYGDMKFCNIEVMLKSTDLP